ncbi:hypothetical protein EZS27_009278 [termite gut metagenome]|uniref:Uncharacterized protein n=1 Tax=termite gut metagenome TaxID=433724 RepID=A0A5J4SA62_9ZZZZ
MAKHLNINKQFIIGNGLLAFAVIFVVVIFVYMSMRVQQEKKSERKYAETYTVTLIKGFAGDSLSFFINDSLLLNKRITKEPVSIEATRFAEQSALIIMDNLTEQVSVFNLSETGEAVSLVKDATGIKRMLRD